MIEIKNVSYSYENAVTDGALKNVSLCIPQGQTVLLCGESGSGKTTFGRLVNGLIPCYYEGKLTGSVMVNGNDTTQLQLHELAGTVGLRVSESKVAVLYASDRHGDHICLREYRHGEAGNIAPLHRDCSGLPA